jgi:hypothetical protein
MSLFERIAAVAFLTAFLAVWIWYVRATTSRARHRRPILTDGALCRRLRALGKDLDPAADECTQRAIADKRAQMIDKLTGGTVSDDEMALRMLAGAHFGPDCEVVRPDGRTLSADEAQALTSYYAPSTAERGGQHG